MSKHFKAVGRNKGDKDWTDVTHNDLMSYSDEEGLPQFAQMVEMMALRFPYREFKIIETEL